MISLGKLSVHSDQPPCLALLYNNIPARLLDHVLDVRLFMPASDDELTEMFRMFA